MIDYVESNNSSTLEDKYLLQKNLKIGIVCEKDIVSCEYIFNQFWIMNTNVLYVVDNNMSFVGIITNRDLLKQIRENKKGKVKINRSCAVLTETSDCNIYEEAKILFEKFNITTAIPVINEEKKILFEIRKRKVTSEEKKIENFKAKISKYEGSYYLKKELIYLRKILENQNIVVVGSEERFDFMFETLIRNKNRIRFLETLENAFEFLSNNATLLIDLSEIGFLGRENSYLFSNNGYSWNQFMYHVMEAIELGYASIFRQIQDENIVTIYDFFKKYMDGEYNSARGIFKNDILKYMYDHRLPVEKEVNNYEREARCYLKINEIKTKNFWFEDDRIAIECINIIWQLYQFNKYIENKAEVLNVIFDEKLELVGNEKKRMEEEFQGSAFTYKELYTLGENKDEKYLSELEQSIQFKSIRSFENDQVVFKDMNSKFVNVENGIRKTSYQPEKYIGTVYFLGGCAIWGNLVEDKYTIPSLIQRKINSIRKKYRVVNLGNNLIEASDLLKSIDIKENDIFVCLFLFVTDHIKKSLSTIEIGREFNELRKSKYKGIECFFDSTQHCGTNGNIILSDIIFEKLKIYLKSTGFEKSYNNNIYNIFKKNFKDLNWLYGYGDYIKRLQYKKNELIPGKKIGCIVMNCNPFTLGHRYLVKRALQYVDYVYLFVLEEEKSYFSFKDRYEMVKLGTCDLKNVFVFRSGNMIISSTTFPTYFHKEKVSLKEKPAVSIDLRVFAQYIAPLVDIKFRFVGEEPEDVVTAEYNKKMKEILPKFGIQVIEIPRMYLHENIISASKVRMMYRKKDFEGMREWVPESTLRYLRKRSDKKF